MQTLHICKTLDAGISCNLYLTWQIVSIDVPVKNGSNSCAVCAVTLQLGGQENSILHSNGAMGEGGDEELIPP